MLWIVLRVVVIEMLVEVLVYLGSRITVWIEYTGYIIQNTYTLCFYQER